MWRLVWWMGSLKYYIDSGILLNRKFLPVLSAKSKWRLFYDHSYWKPLMKSNSFHTVRFLCVLCIHALWEYVHEDVLILGGMGGCRGEVFGNYVALQTKLFQRNRHLSVLVNLTMQLSTSFPGKVTGRKDCGWELRSLLEHSSTLKDLKALARSTNYQWECLWYSLNSLFMNDWYVVPTVWDRGLASCYHGKLRFWLSDGTRWKSCP